MLPLYPDTENRQCCCTQVLQLLALLAASTHKSVTVETEESSVVAAASTLRMSYVQAIKSAISRESKRESVVGLCLSVILLSAAVSLVAGLVCSACFLHTSVRPFRIVVSGQKKTVLTYLY